MTNTYWSASPPWRGRGSFRAEVHGPDSGAAEPWPTTVQGSAANASVRSSTQSDSQLHSAMFTSPATESEASNVTRNGSSPPR